MTQSHESHPISSQSVAWSNGEYISVAPELRDEMEVAMKDDCFEEEPYCYYRAYSELHYDCCDLEACSDDAWKHGDRKSALYFMLAAAERALPDFEDILWLDPEEVPCWDANVRRFLRFMHRSIDICCHAPHLWQRLEATSEYRDYKDYLAAVDRWVRGR